MTNISTTAFSPINDIQCYVQPALTSSPTKDIKSPLQATITSSSIKEGQGAEKSMLQVQQPTRVIVDIIIPTVILCAGIFAAVSCTFDLIKSKRNLDAARELEEALTLVITAMSNTTKSTAEQFAKCYPNTTQVIYLSRV